MARDYARNPSYWEEEDNPFSLSKIAARKPPPGGFNVPAPRAVFPGPRPTAASVAEAGPFAGSDPLPEMPAPSAVPKLPKSLQEDDWISAPDPFITDWNSAAAKRDAQRAEKPLLHDKQYDISWLQKLAMIGTNAAAGLVNASGRTRVAPIDQQTLMRRPKYEQARDKWETEGRALDSELSSMTTKYQMKRQANQDEMAARREMEQRKLNDAIIAEREARAADLAEDKRRPPQDVMGAGGRVWDPVNKRFYENTIPDPKTVARKPPTTIDAALISGTPEEKAAAQAVEDRRLAARAARGAKKDGESPSEIADKRLREFDRQKKVDRLYELEHGNGGSEEGLHAKLLAAGEAMKAADRLKPTKADGTPYDPKAPELAGWRGDSEEANKVKLYKNQLRGVYKDKLNLGLIERDEYNALIQGLDGAPPPGASSTKSTPSTPARPATPTAPPVPTAAPAAQAATPVKTGTGPRKKPIGAF
jgi:hypothetical protein